MTSWRSRSIFFFQAEDGIRDKLVTGVQTCALPISVPLNFDNLRVATKFTDLTGRDDSPGVAIVGRTGIAWGRLVAVGLILAIIGALLLAILLWALWRAKRREPPLVH